MQESGSTLSTLHSAAHVAVQLVSPPLLPLLGGLWGQGLRLHAQPLPICGWGPAEEGDPVQVLNLCLTTAP